jgi:hypothetical protein
MSTKSSKRPSAQNQPRDSSDSALFLIGQNSRGHWVVQDAQGLRGGLFVSLSQARKFALYENGNRPEAIITVPGALELDVGGRQREFGGMSETI